MMTEFTIFTDEKDKSCIGLARRGAWERKGRNAGL